MPVPSLYENRRAVVQHRTEINNYRSILEEKMSPAQLAIEIPDDPAGFPCLSVKDDKGNYHRMVSESKLENMLSGGYVKKSGDTMTGALTINTNGSPPLNLKTQDKPLFEFCVSDMSESARLRAPLIVGSLPSDYERVNPLNRPTTRIMLRDDNSSDNEYPNRGYNKGCLYHFCLHPGSVTHQYTDWNWNIDANLIWQVKSAQMVFCSSGVLNVPRLHAGSQAAPTSDFYGGDIVADGRVKESGKWLYEKYAPIEHSHGASNVSDLYVKKSGDTMTGALKIDINRCEHSLDALHCGKSEHNPGPHLTIKSHETVYNLVVFCTGRAVHNLNSLGQGYEWSLKDTPGSQYPNVKAMLRFAFCSGTRNGVFKRWPYLWIDTVDANGYTYHYNVYSGENALLGDW